MSKLYMYTIVSIGYKGQICDFIPIIGRNVSDIGKYIKNNDDIMYDLMICYSSMDMGHDIFKKYVKEYGMYTYIDFNDDVMVKIRKIFNSIRDENITHELLACRTDVCSDIIVERKEICEIHQALYKPKHDDLNERKDYVKNNLTKLLMNKKL